MKASYSLLFLFILSGCSLLPTNTKEVKLPVFTKVSCVKSVPEKPELLFDGDQDKPIVYQVQDLVIDRLNLLGYSAELEAIVAGCN